MSNNMIKQYRIQLSKEHRRGRKTTVIKLPPLAKFLSAHSDDALGMHSDSLNIILSYMVDIEEKEMEEVEILTVSEGDLFDGDATRYLDIITHGRDEDYEYSFGAIYVFEVKQ